MKNYTRSIKNFGRGLKGATYMTVGIALAIYPYTSVLGLGTIGKGVNDLWKSVNRDYNKNSIMSLKKRYNGKSNYIAQGFPTIKQITSAILSDKKDFLMMQEFNLLMGLDIKDKNGNDIQYNAQTQAINKIMLKELEKKGIIKNYTEKKAEDRSFGLEKFFIGNVKGDKAKEKRYKDKRKAAIKERVSNEKGIVNKVKALREELKIGISKKVKMYDISFERTDKKLSEEEIIKWLPFLAKDGKINESKFHLSKDKYGNITSIDYNTKYIMSTLKQRAKEKALKKGNKIKESLRDLTMSQKEMADNLKEKLTLDKNKEVKREEGIII